MRTYFLEGTCFADQLQRSLMLWTFLTHTLAFLLSLINGVFLQILYNVDDVDAFGQVFLHSPSNHHFRTALRTQKHLPIGLDCEPSSNALLAVGMTAPWDHTRGSVVDVEVRPAERTGWR